MKNKTVWNKPENEFIAETMEDGRKCYYGQYTDKAVPFAFRLTEQPADSRYRCRGTVWAVPPDARRGAGAGRVRRSDDCAAGAFVHRRALGGQVPRRILQCPGARLQPQRVP